MTKARAAIDRPNAKAEQKERTHATILASAARLLRERGIAGARIADVMDGAGLTVGGFYAHFASKEALVREMLRRTSSELRERVFAEIADAPEHARAELVITRYLSRRHRDDPAAGCPFPSVVGEIGARAPEYADVLDEQIGALTSRIESVLPEGAERPRHQRAIALVALLYGGLSLSRALGTSARSDAVLEACRVTAIALSRA